MAAFQVRVGFLPRLYAVEKIADVQHILVLPIARGVFGCFSPKFLPAFSGHGLRPADRMSADDARHDVDRVLFFIRRNFKAVAAENHCAFVSMKRHAAHARLRHTGGALAKLAHGLEAGVFDDHVLNVRHLAVVFQEKSSAGARHCRWPFHTGDPVDRVERVLAEVGHLAAGVIPEPAEMVDGAVRIVRPLRRRAEPHFIIQFRRRISIGRIAKSRRDVAKIVALNGNKFAEPPAADEFARLLIMRAGTLLGSDLHDAFMAARRFYHPTSFAHKQRQRLFHIHVLARGAGQHRHQRVPMVRRRNHHGVHTLVFEQLSEVRVLCDVASDEFHRRFHSRAIRLGDRHHLRVGLCLEIARVNAPHQTKADNADTDAFVGAQDAVP